MAIKGDHESHQAAHNQDCGFLAGHTHALLDEFQNFQEAGANHGGDGQEEGKLRCCASAQAQGMAPKMVAPGREVPGIMDKHWNRPMYTATDQDISLVRRMNG